MKRLFAVAAVAAVALVAAGCVEPPPPPSPPVVTVLVDGQEVTVTGPVGSTLGASVVDPALLPPAPSGLVFPLGALEITVSGITPGSAARVTLDLPAPVTGVQKLIGGVWDPFSFDGTTGATLSADGRTVTLTLLDGGRGDTDGLADGTVVDPLAPSVPAAGLLGCHRSTAGFGDLLVSEGGTSFLGQAYVQVSLRASTDGSCTTAIGDPVKAVLADQSDAAQRCGSASIAVSPAFEARTGGWDRAALAGLWVCAWEPVPAANSMAGSHAVTVTGSQTCGLINGQQFCSPGGSTSVSQLPFLLDGPCDGTSACRLTLPDADTINGDDLRICGTLHGGGYRFSTSNGLLGIDLVSADPSSGQGSGEVRQITGGSPQEPIAVIESIDTQRTAENPALLGGCA